MLEMGRQAAQFIAGTPPSWLGAWMVTFWVLVPLSNANSIIV